MVRSSFPKWGKTWNGATSFLDFPTDFAECIRTNMNQMTNVQEAGHTDLENQMEQAEFASCHLIDIKICHRFPSSKRKQQDECVKENATASKVENLIYL